MRDNFYEYEDSNGYHIVLNYPEDYPARHIWYTQVTREMVANEGLESIRSRVKSENASLEIQRRPRYWNAE